MLLFFMMYGLLLYHEMVQIKENKSAVGLFEVKKINCRESCESQQEKVRKIVQ